MEFCTQQADDAFFPPKHTKHTEKHENVLGHKKSQQISPPHPPKNPTNAR